ncbi:MAG TPA: zinc ribbon domain-containing protein [Desulfomonilaceae bacterium]|nr:zinc ribbon domain-containing protein [Desulfomonilaceae bacterium]HVN83064.1 zinc ribbon domain-containing protein [Terriglobia bacterium]
MEKSSQKINAKVFLQNFREGKTDEELMRLHNLTPGIFAKLIKVLQEKNLLDPAELKSRRAIAPTEPEIRIPIPEPYEFTPADPVEEIRAREGAYQDPNFCPRCGAHVNERMLSCPECGHVLPGRERWEAVESEKRLTERIPARVLGYIMAIPIGIMLFFLFKDVIMPMAEAPIEKRAEALRRETPEGKTPLQAAEDMAKAAGSGIIKLELQRWINDDLISSANEDHTVFTAGSRWPNLSYGEKRKVLQDISSALRKSGKPVDFDLVNDAGEALALVRGQSIKLYEEGGPRESAESAVELGEQPARPSVGPDILDRIPKYLHK